MFVSPAKAGADALPKSLVCMDAWIPASAGAMKNYRHMDSDKSRNFKKI